MPVKKKTPARRKAPVRKTMAAPGPMAAKDVRANYKQRKKAEVQAWFIECMGTRPKAGLFAKTYGKKSGVYGNPERIVVVYGMGKLNRANAPTYAVPVGVIKYGYGNGLMDAREYLTVAQFSKFWYNDSVDLLETSEFNGYTKMTNLIYF